MSLSVRIAPHRPAGAPPIQVAITHRPHVAPTSWLFGFQRKHATQHCTLSRKDHMAPLTWLLTPLVGIRTSLALNIVNFPQARVAEVRSECSSHDPLRYTRLPHFAVPGAAVSCACVRAIAPRAARACPTPSGPAESPVVGRQALGPWHPALVSIHPLRSILKNPGQPGRPSRFRQSPPDGESGRARSPPEC